MRLFAQSPLALSFLGLLLVLAGLEVALLAAYAQAVRHRAPGVTAGRAWQALARGRSSPTLAAVLTPTGEVALGRARRFGRAMLGAVTVRRPHGGRAGRVGPPARTPIA